MENKPSLWFQVVLATYHLMKCETYTDHRIWEETWSEEIKKQAYADAAALRKLQSLGILKEFEFEIS